MPARSAGLSEADARSLHEQIGDDAAQPSIPRIGVLAAMPVLLDVERRYRIGRRKYLQFDDPPKYLADRLRHSDDEIGRCDDHRDAQEMRRAQQLPPAYALLLQILLDDFLAAPFTLHHRVWQVAELLFRQRALNRQMPGTHKANEAVSEQALLEKIDTVDVREIADRQIDFPPLQGNHEFPRRHLDRPHIDGWRFGHQPPQQLRQERHLADIDHRDGEAATYMLGVEAGRRQHLLTYIGQHRLDDRRHLSGARRGPHPVRHLHEERITDLSA